MAIYSDFMHVISILLRIWENAKLPNLKLCTYNKRMTSFRVIDQSKTNSTFRINWRKKEKSTCISSHFWKMVVLVYKMSFRKGSRYVNHSLWAIYCGTRPIEREMIPFLLLASTLWLVRQVVKGAFFKPSLPREISETNQRYVAVIQPAS